MSDTPPPYQPEPTQQLSHHAYYQLIHTLAARLPPPLADTPEALLARNQAAIAQVAALLPTNANEAALAAQCVATRAQADDVLRLLRAHDGDIKAIIKLNAQYVAMVRASLGAHGHLLRAQAIRHKREQGSAAVNADEWTQHIAACSMQRALDEGPLLPAAPAAAPSVPAQAAEPPSPAPEPASLAPKPPPALTAVQPRIPPAAVPPPPVPAAAPSQPHRTRTAAQTDEPARDLAAEADYYANVYPRRAQPIRRYGGLPPNCDFGPPDEDLVRAIVSGTSPALRALDAPVAPTA